jgi:hypothetical protein
MTGGLRPPFYYDRFLWQKDSDLSPDLFFADFSVWITKPIKQKGLLWKYINMTRSLRRGCQKC